MMHRRRLMLVLALLAGLYCTSWFKIMTWSSFSQNQASLEMEDNTAGKNIAGQVETEQLAGPAITYKPMYSKEEINPHHFHFLIANVDACTSADNTSVFLVMLVKSSVEDVYDREQIRRTWGGDTVVKDKRTLTMFLLGTITGNQTTTLSVKEENDRYNDIIQEDFVDSYQNLTIKNMMGLKWISMYCPNVTYVASVDADVMINVNNLVTRLSDKPRRQFAEGSLRAKAAPVRDSKGNAKKWYTPKEVYPEATYAPFFPGSCYVMSGDVAISIYAESSHVRYLPWDDVFVGLVMKRIGVTPLQGRGYEKYPRKYENNTLRWTLKHAIAVIIRHQKHKVDERLIKIWQTVANTQKHDKFDKYDVLLIFLAVIGVLVVYLLIALAFLIKCRQDESDLDDYESDDSFVD
ncbi:beta-1,3-galactosyltransferase 1-like [Patiria miniata]|uniref:Hexosyltransferase n=1 Tax=Patiria miniata TaxID=46514 RepID=A0A913Z5U6_PATMI|nr:beta-1,3-galactosyltransferase 1-like [Patiria miniata]